MISLSWWIGRFPPTLSFSSFVLRVFLGTASRKEAQQAQLAEKERLSKIPPEEQRLRHALAAAAVASRTCFRAFYGFFKKLFHVFFLRFPKESLFWGKEKNKVREGVSVMQLCSTSNSVATSLAVAYWLCHVLNLSKLLELHQEFFKSERGCLAISWQVRGSLNIMMLECLCFIQFDFFEDNIYIYIYILGPPEPHK